jgi:hypothetical protein
MPDEGSTVCSGHGECRCGTCQCDKKYEGKYCEKPIQAVSIIKFVVACDSMLVDHTLQYDAVVSLSN